MVVFSISSARGVLDDASSSYHSSPSAHSEQQFLGDVVQFEFQTKEEKLPSSLNTSTNEDDDEGYELLHAAAPFSHHALAAQQSLVEKQQDHISELEQETTEYRHEIRRVKAEYNMLKTKLEAATTENDSLRVKLMTAEIENRKYFNERHSLQQEFYKLSNLKEELSHELEEKEQALTNALHRIDELQHICRNHKKEIERLKLGAKYNNEDPNDGHHAKHAEQLAAVQAAAEQALSRERELSKQKLAQARQELLGEREARARLEHELKIAQEKLAEHNNQIEKTVDSQRKKVTKAVKAECKAELEAKDNQILYLIAESDKLRCVARQHETEKQQLAVQVQQLKAHNYKFVLLVTKLVSLALAVVSVLVIIMLL